MSTILQYFPKHLQAPRQAQIDILLKLEENWNKYDVFIVSAPVALGKSAIANTIAQWSGSAAIVTPSNLLRQQYSADYPELHTLKKIGEYRCHTLGNTVEYTKRKLKRLCTPALCPGCDQYRADLFKSEIEPIVMGNYYSYALGAKAFRETLIIDEAHNINKMIQELAAVKIWQHKAQFPIAMRSRLQMMEWAEQIPEWKLNLNPNLQLFKREILSDKPHYLFQVTWESFRGEKKQLVKMLPVNIRGLSTGKMIWPTHKVKKIVMLSATINEFDIKQFGLEDKRVMTIEADSPISADRRPVIIPDTRQSMAFKNQEESLPQFLTFLTLLAEHYKDSKGLIHVTYSLARQLQVHLEGNMRFMFHDNKDKIQVYNQFRATEEPRILVACGMNEGIDLPGDLCRWQVIAKIPYPSLADPALRWMAMRNHRWYAWQSIKDTIQATGRVCRSPDDYGETFIFDSCFLKLFNQNADMFPKWFKDSLVWEEVA